MPNLTKIKNSHLRQLVLASDAIMSLPEDELQELVDDIAQLSGKDEKPLIRLLEEQIYEQQREEANAQEAMSAMEVMEEELKATARKFESENARKAESSSAEKFLKSSLK